MLIALKRQREKTIATMSFLGRIRFCFFFATTKHTASQLSKLNRKSLFLYFTSFLLFAYKVVNFYHTYTNLKHTFAENVQSSSRLLLIIAPAGCDYVRCLSNNVSIEFSYLLKLNSFLFVVDVVVIISCFFFSFCSLSLLFCFYKLQ